MTAIKLAVFDCDGTLIDGQASICEAMEAAFAELGFAAPDRNEIRRAVGLSLPQAARRLLPGESDECHHAIAEAYKRAFRIARTEGRIAQPLYHGIAPLLVALRGAGWSLAVATGMSERGLAHCLAMHGLTDRFVSLQTADHHPSKPHPAMLAAALYEADAQAGDAVMIGDTAFDIQMAANAGVRAIGVSWGYHAAHELIEAGAEHVATTPGQLAEYLLR